MGQFEDRQLEVGTTIIEAELSLFQLQLERMSGGTFELCQRVLGVTNVNQSIVAWPAAGIDGNIVHALVFMRRARVFWSLNFLK